MSDKKYICENADDCKLEFGNEIGRCPHKHSHEPIKMGSGIRRMKINEIVEQNGIRRVIPREVDTRGTMYCFDKRGLCCDIDEEVKCVEAKDDEDIQ